jgi:hypothetical protein
LGIAHAFLKVAKGLKKKTFFGKFRYPYQIHTEEGHDGVYHQKQ